jgi:hypothetical protein
MDARLSLLNLAPNRRHAETQRFAPEWGRLTGPSHECPSCTGNALAFNVSNADYASMWTVAPENELVD